MSDIEKPDVNAKKYWHLPTQVALNTLDREHKDYHKLVLRKICEHIKLDPCIDELIGDRVVEAIRSISKVEEKR